VRWINLAYDVAQWQDIARSVMKYLVLVRKNISLLDKHFCRV